MRSARWWKQVYERERAELGEAGMRSLIERAPDVRLPAGGALVFPHARLSACGEQVAAAARAVVASGCEEVLALGVLHGGRECDAALVKRAKEGDETAVAALRRVHGPGTERDEERWAEEFSLDGFASLLAVAARAASRKPPRLIARFPFLVGRHPETLPGLDELRGVLGRGAALVATADHVHHGVGYRTPRDQCLPADDPRARVHARTAVEASLALLAQGNWAGFQRFAKDMSSDFRDPGPVLATLLSERGPWDARVASLELAGYADVLACEEPTWVAAALVEITPLHVRAPAPPRPQRGCG